MWGGIIAIQGLVNVNVVHWKTLLLSINAKLHIILQKHVFCKKKKEDKNKNKTKKQWDRLKNYSCFPPCVLEGYENQTCCYWRPTRCNCNVGFPSVDDFIIILNSSLPCEVLIRVSSFDTSVEMNIWVLFWIEFSMESLLGPIKWKN